MAAQTVALLDSGAPHLPEKLQNHRSAFGYICQLSGTWMALNSILIDFFFYF